MNPLYLDESILYSTESRNDFLTLASELVADFQPANAQENEILERMLEAEWLKRRYTKVRARLYDRKRMLTPASPEEEAVVKSIEHFQIEVDSQKVQLANLRRSLRRMRDSKATGRERRDNDALLAA